MAPVAETPEGVVITSIIFVIELTDD